MLVSSSSKNCMKQTWKMSHLCAERFRNGRERHFPQIVRNSAVEKTRGKLFNVFITDKKLSGNNFASKSLESTGHEIF